MEPSIDNYKVGFVSIFGRPNVGKSTFLNTLLGQKVSIVSSVPQTTRKKILGMYNDDQSQIIFYDTPGIHKSDKPLNISINEEALGTLKGADVICYFVDPTRPRGEEEEYLEKIFNSITIPKIKVFTKKDISQKEPEGSQTISISSKTKEGFDILVQKIKQYLPTGPLLYPKEYYTYQPMSQRAEEVVREKIFLWTKDEIPHSIFVKVDDIQDTPQLLRILCYIYTETESQKTIIIGRSGTFLSKIGKLAREELESIFGKKIFLSLRVKVYPKWRQDKALLKDMFDKKK